LQATRLTKSDAGLSRLSHAPSASTMTPPSSLSIHLNRCLALEAKHNFRFRRHRPPPSLPHRCCNRMKTILTVHTLSSTNLLIVAWSTSWSRTTPPPPASLSILASSSAAGGALSMSPPSPSSSFPPDGVMGSSPDARRSRSPDGCRRSRARRLVRAHCVRVRIHGTPEVIFRGDLKDRHIARDCPHRRVGIVVVVIVPIDVPTRRTPSHREGGTTTTSHDDGDARRDGNQS
jgi:hypothetical protein